MEETDQKLTLNGLVETALFMEDLPRKHDVDLSEIRWESGACSLYFRDPDGHMIELATRGIWEAP